jgi:hypothetical protein
MDRRTGEAVGCVVCSSRDARTLSSTRLADGTSVTVCGSHKIAHRKSERLAGSIDELRVMLGERRKKTG